MSDVLIVGGGLAGLCCALELEQGGFSCLVFEASDGVGGRVRTDEINGFRLDRGFQVLLEAYPECRRVLDYSQLQLKSFEPGALVWFRGKLRTLADPRRRPSAIMGDVFSPLASLGDKLRMARYVLKLENRSLDDLLSAPETSTAVALAKQGFSPAITERFLRPFLGGTFLERQLATSSRKFDYVMRMFADGAASVPSLGMQAVPAQVAGRLRADSIRLNSRVRSVTATSVTLESGEQIAGKAVVIAADFAQASALDARITTPPSNKVTCLYFMAHEPPLRGPYLVLNGEGESDGPVNNVAVMTEVSPAYGPPGTALISVSVVGAVRDARLEAPVRVQLSKWFGAQVSRWFLLKAYEIEDAIPRQTPQTGGVSARSPRISEGLYVCGDYCDTASINGAMLSGRRAAEAAREDLGGK